MKGGRTIRVAGERCPIAERLTISG